MIDRILNSRRLLCYDELIIIEKYDKIVSLSSSKIVTSYYQVNGTNLHVKSLDGHILQIEGKVTEIQIGGFLDETISN